MSRQQSHLGQGGIPGHIRHISEDARGHSPSAVEGIAQGGGGNTNPSAPVPFLISERGQMASHLWVAGGQVFDPFTRGINQASGWTEVGTIPRVAAAVPPGCDGRRTVEGLGPFSDANYLSLGTGSDVLDFAGDFSGCVVFAPSTVDATQRVLVGDGQDSASGWEVYTSVLGSPYAVIFSTTGVRSQIGVSNSPIVGLNVGCFGRAGSSGYAKLNLGTLAIAAAGVITPGIAWPATVGRYAPLTGQSATVDTIYELWFSAATPSDALFTAIANEVKGRLGVTAW